MLLDSRFPTDYYLRILELVIRDPSCRLVYNRQLRMLEAVPFEQKLSSNQEGDSSILREVISELLAHSGESYAISARLLAIIDIYLKQAQPSNSFFARVFRKKERARKRRIANKLLCLKSILFFERQRPVKKVASVAGSILHKPKGNFSSWEDFTHDVQPQKSNAEEGALDSLRDRVEEDAASQTIVEVLLAFLDDQDMYLSVSFEILRYFLEEKVLSKRSLSPRSHNAIRQIKDLYLVSPEDFQTFIGGIITESLFEEEDQLVVGCVIFSQEGKKLFESWKGVTQKYPHDMLYTQAFLAEVVLHVVQHHIHLNAKVKPTSPEQVGSLYSIRDHSPRAWARMMRVLLMRWLLDYHFDVYAYLKEEILRCPPRQPFWQIVPSESGDGTFRREAR
ncbi:hypothetical protein [Chlamydia sp.]|uniref:hypothetical protein n=1 Tax=Chlamydia sp. TaxID=35827 RepID=UPI0025C0C5D8|nr:hypothetical protein [Chlamydia sp.]MBQ8498808.1 hypothetical protein [Chlamydia sp.]